MRPIQTPNLPSGPVGLVALSAGRPYIREALEARGIGVLEVPPHPALPTGLACHADLQLHPLGNGRVLLARGGERQLEKALRGAGFAVKLSEADLGPQYPADIPFCCFALEGRLYCLPAHTAPEILGHYDAVRPVRQGYARCATCIVDSRSIVTSDPGIARAAAEEGIGVLRIRPGGICLPGYDTGLIGGCAGLLAPSLLAFAGDLDTHPDGSRIRAFCRSRGVEAVSLSPGPLLDVGGLLPLLEEA